MHFRDESERLLADEVLGYLERSWQVEVADLGFPPPVSDEGQCGPDGGFDVFLWRTHRTSTVIPYAHEGDTWWDDYSTVMILDPWGPDVGDHLPALVAHVLNHAMQAAVDSSETRIFFDMTAWFVEDQVYDDDDRYQDHLFDFQGNPQWAFDFDDSPFEPHYLSTRYMDGSALYLFYLRDGVLDGDASFVSALWEACRNAPNEREPDFEDALEMLLTERAGMSFQDSLVQFSRWRYYTGTRDDGAHFEEGATFPEDSLVHVERRERVTTSPIEVPAGPMLMGVQYVELFRGEGDPTDFSLAFAGDGAVAWSVQAVPGLDGSDGEVLDISSGSTLLGFGALTQRTLVILALPSGGYDPEHRADGTYDYSLTLAPL